MLHDEVVAAVRERLIEGMIAPGARIPERELCDALGISRTPLREALKALAAEGLVVLLPHRGARAARLTHKSMQDLFEVCESLEAAAGELACGRISNAEVARIGALHAEMVAHHAAQDLVQYFRCNRLIHEAIVQAADNAVLSALYENVAGRIRRARFLAPMTPERWALAVQEHEGILNALRRRDGRGLAHILQTHLRQKREEVERAGFAGDEDPSGDESPARTARTRPQAQDAATPEVPAQDTPRRTTTVASS